MSGLEARSTNGRRDACLTVRRRDACATEVVGFGVAEGADEAFDIVAAAFEVGADVRDAFVHADPAANTAFKPQREGKWLADLFLLARQRLARHGVRRIYGGGLCTFADPARFYSYRRDPTTGRMAALIWLTDAG